MQTTRVLLVRHGATTLSAEDRFAASVDVDLSDEGRRQAQRLAQRNVLDFRDTVRARLMLFNDVSHYEDVPDPPGAAHLSKWWGEWDG